MSGLPTYGLIKQHQESAVLSKSQPGDGLTASSKTKANTDSKHIQNIINNPVVSSITGPGNAAPAYGPAYAPAYPAYSPDSCGNYGPGYSKSMYEKTSPGSF